MLEAVYYDTEKGLVVAIKPKPPFLPLLDICSGLTQKEGIFTTPALAGIGDPDGIRTHDLHRDRVAC